MKIPQKSKEKRDKVKKKEITKPKNDQVLTVAQEIRFARLLSGNEKKSRDKVLKTLKKWLLSGFEKKDVGPHSSFTMLKCKEEDFIRIWKGLFYGVWLSDKPLVQEDLCENIASILDLFPTEYLKHALLMYKAGLRVLATQWYGIDHHRMDKFLMLVRRCLRASLRCLLRSEWDLDSCRLYTEMISGSDGILAVKTPRYARNATSMILHFLDCYLEEIAKVSEGAIAPPSLAELLRPVCALTCAGDQPVLISASRRVLTALLRQSEHGIQYQQAAAAWQRMGCPEGGPEALELVSDDEEQNDAEQNGDDDFHDESAPRALDPRAGRVNVELPCLPVPADLLANMLRELLTTASGKAHKRLKICLQRFEKLARDEYPLRINEHVMEVSPTHEVKPTQVAHSLQTLEKTLVTDSDELALRGLSRKHRKRLLAKSRSGMSIVEDVETVRQKISNATVGKWQVDPAEPEPLKMKQDKPVNKENKKRKNDINDNKEHKRRKTNKIKGEETRNSNVGKFNGEEKKKFKVGKMPTVVNNIKKFKNKISKDGNSDKISEHKQSDIKKDDMNKINKHKQNDATKHGINKINIHKNNIKENETSKQNGIKKNKINETGSDRRPQQHRDKIIKTGNTLNTEKSKNKNNKILNKNTKPTVLVNKVKNFQKQSVKTNLSPNKLDAQKKVKFVLKNNSMQAPIDYYKSIRQSPNIPFDGTKKPTKTNLKPSTPSPINPFFKKKQKLKF